MAASSVAILNPFDPLWVEEKREGRYAYLARRLAERGFAVTWITSDWSHRHKRRRDTAAIQAAGASVGVRVEFVATRPYLKNISVGRLWSHAQSSKAAARLLQTLAPDVVVVSSPPPELAGRAVAVARRVGAASIVDVQDLWPSTFRRFWPPGLKWMNRIVFRPQRAAYARACRYADALVGVAEEYVADARLFGRTRRTEVIHIGIDVAAFDAAARAGRNLLEGERGPDRPVLFWGGTISAPTDWPCTLEALARLLSRYPTLLLAVVGTGPDEPAMRAAVAERGLGEHVRFFGFQPYEAYVATLLRSDVAIHAMRADSEVAFPNRPFDFMASGKPIVNSVVGEFGDLVEREGIGLNYPAESAERMAEAFARLLDNKDLCRDLGRRGRRLAEERFERSIEYERYIKLCEVLAAKPRRRPTG